MVFATILHYNIPLHLVTEYGGWKSRKTVECYVRYTRTLFERLGDRVDYWLPFNEFNAGKFNPYNGVCLIEDQEEDYQNAIFQCLHHMDLALHDTYGTLIDRLYDRTLHHLSRHLPPGGQHAGRP